MATLSRPRNDPGQYDDLADEWWRERGAFCALHWLAVARSRLVPPPARPGAVLLDVACGGGLLAPHLVGRGYHHVGVDLGRTAAAIARDHGVVPVQGDACRLPVATASVDVVVAGEIFEHVRDLDTVVAEIARVLRPGGTLVCDTLADTALCRLLMVSLGERLGVAPPGIHDPSLFVDPGRLRLLCEAHGITLRVSGLRPRIPQGLAWALRLRSSVEMVPTRSVRVVYQGVGVRDAA